MTEQHGPMILSISATSSFIQRNRTIRERRRLGVGVAHAQSIVSKGFFTRTFYVFFVDFFRGCVKIFLDKLQVVDCQSLTPRGPLRGPNAVSRWFSTSYRGRACAKVVKLFFSIFREFFSDREGFWKCG